MVGFPPKSCEAAPANGMPGGGASVFPRVTGVCCGRVRTHEPTGALLQRLEAGTARILRATVSREGGRWFVSFPCAVERAVGRPPRPLKKALRRLARLHRERARRRPGSRNRAETRERIAGLHAHVAQIRPEALHQITTRLARTYRRWGWNGSTWPACCGTGAWRGRRRTPPGRRFGASSRTRRSGTDRGWWRRTRSTQAASGASLAAP